MYFGNISRGATNTENKTGKQQKRENSLIWFSSTPANKLGILDTKEKFSITTRPDWEDFRLARFFLIKPTSYTTKKQRNIELNTVLRTYRERTHSRSL